jgi:hypothetical protein
VFERWRQRLAWDGTQGQPRSSNAASSFHLTWLGAEPDPGRSWVAVEATLEVTTPPAVPALYFWALQASFTDRGRDGGAGHLGLQWHPQHPGSTAVNWGGYDPAGRELDGSAAALPSALDNPNTRDLGWSSGVPYRLSIRRAMPDEHPAPVAPVGTTAWRGEVTDLASGRVTVVRDLYAIGSGLVAPVMWSEVFARCDDPTAAVRWYDLRLADDAGGQRAVERVRVSYQARADGGCATTDVVVDASGVHQVTGTVRRTRAGAELVVGQPERS